jgi:hypothetical protein
VKLNFAVAGGKIGLFKREYFYLASEVLESPIARSRSRLGASLLAAACENRLFWYKIGSWTKEENLIYKNAQKL